MNDPNQQQRVNGESTLEVVGEAAEIGVDVASEGIVDMAIDGVTAVAEIAGEVVGGVLDIG